MSKDKPQDSVVRVAAEVGSKTALDVYAREKEKERRSRTDRRLRDTKRLLRNYREIKIHAGEAIASLADMADGDFDFFRELMKDEFNVSSIVNSKARSAIMLAHIDAMIQAYQVICYSSKRPEEQRRYRVLEAMYLLDESIPASEIADRENIDIRTVYKDIDIACERMSALLFGIQFVDRE